MNRSKVIFNISLALVTTFSCLTHTSPARAEQPVNFPSSYLLPGLTFDSLINPPSQPADLNELLQTISFEKNEPLLISLETSSINLVDIVAPPIIVTEPSITPTIDPSPSPTIIPATPLPKIKPINTPKPEASSSPITQPTTSPTQTPKAISLGELNADKLFDMSNNYRSSKGLPPFQKDARVCELATSRAPEINAEIAEGHMHSGLRARNLPYWNSENIISMNTEEAAFNWWINDQIHREAIESDKKYSCVACSGNACAQEFTSYQPK